MSSTIIRISLEPIYLSLLHAGRPSALTNEDLSILKGIIEASTSLYLDQMQQKLSYVREVVVSVIPISRALRTPLFGSGTCHVTVFGNVSIFTKLCKGL